MAHTQEAARSQGFRLPGSQESTEKGTGEVVRELWALTKDYARQETVDPLKALGRFVAFGVPGAVLIGTGVILVSLGLLRLLQNETGSALDGYLSFVPYLVTLVLTLVVIALAARAITSTRTKEHDA